MGGGPGGLATNPCSPLPSLSSHSTALRIPPSAFSSPLQWPPLSPPPSNRSASLRLPSSLLPPPSSLLPPPSSLRTHTHTRTSVVEKGSHCSAAQDSRTASSGSNTSSSSSPSISSPPAPAAVASPINAPAPSAAAPSPASPAGPALMPGVSGDPCSQRMACCSAAVSSQRNLLDRFWTSCEGGERRVVV
mgnify:CR=1 FL=1